MTLSLTIGRDAFKICHKEGARTTVWDVSKNDSEESLIQTFKDVIAFVEGSGDEPRLPVKHRTPPLAVSAAAVGPEPPTNGWAAVYGPPELPKGSEFEVIPEGEQA